MTNESQPILDDKRLYAIHEALGSATKAYIRRLRRTQFRTKEGMDRVTEPLLVGSIEPVKELFQALELTDNQKMPFAASFARSLLNTGAMRYVQDELKVKPQDLLQTQELQKKVDADRKAEVKRTVRSLLPHVPEEEFDHAYDKLYQAGSDVATAFLTKRLNLFEVRSLLARQKAVLSELPEWKTPSVQQEGLSVPQDQREHRQAIREQAIARMRERVKTSKIEIKKGDVPGLPLDVMIVPDISFDSLTREEKQQFIDKEIQDVKDTWKTDKEFRKRYQGGGVIVLRIDLSDLPDSQ